MTSLLLVLLLAQTPAEQSRVAQLESFVRDGAMPSIDAVVARIKGGIADPSPQVRQAALAVLQYRSLQSLWAGTRGPESGPRPPGMPPPPARPMIPLEWRGDRARLRSEFFGVCVALLRSDPSDDVRHSALLAAANLDVDAPRARRISVDFQEILLSVILSDRSPQVRQEATKTIRLAGLETPQSVQALAQVLVDPVDWVRHDARLAIYTSTAGPVVKVRFADARAVLVAALSNANPGIRTGALEAFGDFQKDSMPEITAIEKVASTDPNPEVRALAGRVAASIRK